MGKKESIREQYVTGKGELTGFVSIITPSTKFNKDGVYSCNILLPKEEGEKLEAKIKEIRKEQYKTYGKGTKLADITACMPYTTQNEDGEEIPDSEGRYILKAKAKAYIKDGKSTYKPRVINAKKQDVKNVSIGEGTIVRLGLTLEGYSVANKTGVSVKLGLVQIIELVEYSGAGFSLDGFDEEEGFDGVGTDDLPDVITEDTDEEEEEQVNF